MPYANRFLLCLLICGFALLLSGSAPARCDDKKPKPLSNEAKLLLDQAENTKLESKVRIEAVRKLADLVDAAAADRLIALLPGEYDAFTLNVVGALGRIKDSKAVPALKAIYNEQTVEVPGKIRAAISWAITECGGDPNKPCLQLVDPAKR